MGRTFEVNKSICPVGLTFPLSAKRLEEEDKYSWGEKLVAKLWAEQNIYNGHPLAGPPLAAVLFHECTQECAKLGEGQHAYHMPSDEMLKAANATMQWLGTNVGQGFLDKVQHEIQEESRRRRAIPDRT